MRFSTPTPVLLVEDSRIRAHIDPQDPANLFGMWSAFSKASGIIENGKRLENLSWRLWTQAKFREHKHPKDMLTSTCSEPMNIEARPEDHDAPRLSNSVESIESAASMDSFSHTDRSPPEPLTSSLGIPFPGEQVITSDTLSALVATIKTTQELQGPLSPLPSPQPQQTSPLAEETSSTVSSVTEQPSIPTPRASSPRQIRHNSSESTSRSVKSTSTAQTSPPPVAASVTSPSSSESDHSIVHGFRPGQKSGISTYRSQSQLAKSPVPILKTSSTRKSTPGQKKKVGLFEIGSGGSSDGSPAMQDQLSPKSAPRGSLRGSSLKRPAFGKKQTSFKEEVTEIPKKGLFQLTEEDDGAAIESESEDESASAIEEEVSDSAIDEDDDGAWEDENEPLDEPRPLTFQRVDSKPNLTSRRSMLADQLHSNDRQAALLRAASTGHLRRSRTSTPNGPSMPVSPSEDSPLNTKGPQGRPIPVNNQRFTPGFHPPMPPMSPRQTRLNMVNQELGTSLRKQMLHEREVQKAYVRSPIGLLPRRAVSSLDMRRVQEQTQGLNLSSNSMADPNNAPEVDHNEWYFDRTSNYHESGW